MEIDTTWVWVFLSLYIIYCFSWGLRGFFTEKTSYGYSIGGRQIPMIAFLMAATAASFSGWTTIGHPGLIWQYGLAYGFVSFYALTIPLTGSFFAKRAWLMGKRYGFVTPGDMYAYYYNREGVRWLAVLTAILFGVFYAAIQLMAAGALFHWVTGFPLSWGAILMAFIVWFYVVTGGLKASTWVGVVQFILLMVAMLTVGAYVLAHFGGWSHMSQEINNMPDRFLEIPSVIEFTVGQEKWTAIMILTYLFALMGIQASPAFTMWQFANKNPKPFAWQQVFMSAFLVGFAMFFFTAFQGLGGQILDMQGLIDPARDSDVVPMLMAKFLPPFVLGICFIGLIAAMHSTAAPYIGTAGSMLLRDVWWLKIRNKQGGHAEQIWMNRLFVTILTILALVVGLTSQAALVILGALATSLGFIMYIPLLGTLWGFRWPSIGTVLGILAGIIAVFMTYYVFPNPLTIHCAAWGIGTGLLVAYLSRLLGRTDDQDTLERQSEVRSWLDNIEAPSPSGRTWRNSMKFVVPLWFLFAAGPLAMMGNWGLFSFAGFPSAWSWQIAWWIVGIIMMWALCFKAEMATITNDQIRRAETESNIVVQEVT